MTSRKQIKYSNQLSLPQRDDCKPRKDTKNCIAKQGPNTEPSQTMRATINNESTTTEPPHLILEPIHPHVRVT